MGAVPLMVVDGALVQHFPEHAGHTLTPMAVGRAPVRYGAMFLCLGCTSCTWISRAQLEAMAARRAVGS